MRELEEQRDARRTRRRDACVTWFLASLHGLLSRLETMDCASGAPGTAPASRQAIASSEPRRCPALRFMEEWHPGFLMPFIQTTLQKAKSDKRMACDSI